MTDFDQTLETCLDELTSGASTLDECLIRHPEHATQLEPLLQTAVQLQQGREVKPSVAFKARARASLTLHMQAHPRAKTRSRFATWRLATALAVAMLALLVTGTAYAQGVLPGNPFYGWKLTSEYAWRSVSSNPANVDIIIADRRIGEMNAVYDPVHKAQALKGYQEAVSRLESEVDAETLQRVLRKIESEKKPTPKPLPVIPLPRVEVTATPHAVSTHVPPDLPNVKPTKSKPKKNPTIEVPPPIR